MNKHTNIIIKIIRMISVTLLLLVLSVLFAASPPGLRMIAAFAARRVKAETGLELKVDGIHMSLRPFSINVQQVDLAEQDKPPFIVLSDLHLSFKGFARDLPVDASAAIVRFLPPFPGVDYLADGAALSGRFAMAGSLADPRVSLILESGHIRPREGYWDGPPVRMGFSMECAAGRLTSALEISGLPGSPLTAELDLPVDFSIRPFQLGLREKDSVSGSLFAATDLGALSRLLVLDVHRLHGGVSAAMKLGGSLADPHFTGGLSVQGGYENERTGTILRNIELVMGASRDSLIVEQASAVDGARGRVTASGGIQLRHGRLLPYELRIMFDNFEFMRTDFATAHGNGELLLHGNSDAAAIEGVLSITPLEINIPERIGSSVVALPIREINLSPGRVSRPAAVPREVNYPVRLGIRVEVPDRAYVRGRGLDSEWGGNLLVEGSLQRPLVSGDFSVIRGRFMFFGRRLVIRRGRIMLDGSYPPAPLLDVAAVTRTAGITANMELSGSLAAPVINLYSIPELPEDELLARLLFGRDVARITPLQALTLARAANSLRGRRSTFDLLGEGRRLLHVDQLDIRGAESEGEQPVVSVGKYLGDRVYLELERGVGVDESRAVIQIELSPRISLETEVGAEADAGLSLWWNWEY